MKSFYWLSFTRWNTYKFMDLRNGYLLAKRIYYKKWRWTPFIKITFHNYKNYNYGKKR